MNNEQTTTAEQLFSFTDRKTGNQTRNLTKEAVAMQIIEQSWTTNYYLDIIPTEDGRWSLAGESHFIDAEGDWDCKGFVQFVAASKDAVLDYVLRPHIECGTVTRESPS